MRGVSEISHDMNPYSHVRVMTSGRNFEIPERRNAVREEREMVARQASVIDLSKYKDMGPTIMKAMYAGTLLMEQERDTDYRMEM